MASTSQLGLDDILDFGEEFVNICREANATADEYLKVNSDHIYSIRFRLVNAVLL